MYAGETQHVARAPVTDKVFEVGAANEPALAIHFEVQATPRAEVPGRVKSVDMGLARSDRPTDGDVTKSGVTLGTFD